MTRNALKQLEAIVVNFFGKITQPVPLNQLVAAIVLCKVENGEAFLIEVDEPKPDWMMVRPSSSLDGKLFKRCSELAMGMYTYPTYLLQPNPLVSDLGFGIRWYSNMLFCRLL